MAGDRFNLQRLRDELRPMRLYWFPRLRSTNDHAAVLRKRGELFAPAVVLAGRQTAGRGRGSNTWWSSGGSLTVTFAVPIEEHLSPQQIPLAAGLAVRNAAAELAGDSTVGLKWPNDVVYEGRKVAGLLCERVHRVDLIGVGLNLNLEPADAPASLRRRITSLAAIAGRGLDSTTALVTLARHLRTMLTRRSARPFADILAEYDRHHVLVGCRLTVSGVAGGRTVVGRCEGLDGTGRLLVRDGREICRIVAGHVEQVEPPNEAV